MNIGILSMQKIHNYGSFLQAFSLKMQFEARGHHVYFIDILPGRQVVSSSSEKTCKYLLSKFDKYFFKRIENYFLSKKMHQIHIQDYESYLDTQKKLPENEFFDLVVIGSDEVFNATGPSPWGFSSQLFGDIKNAKCVVTYAASCGQTTAESAECYGITDELRNSMQNLQLISVRDQNTKKFVEAILGITPLRHLDPVFSGDFDSYIPSVFAKKPYMLVYAYPNRIYDPKEIVAIKAYAKKRGLDILCVGMQQRWNKKNISASAFELLAYVKNASCVVTDTFHGTVFSIKYNKQFVSIVRESNRNKLGDLLSQFDLQERCVSDVSTFEQAMNAPIDFASVNNIIERERNHTHDYLDRITHLGEKNG